MDNARVHEFQSFYKVHLQHIEDIFYYPQTFLYFQVNDPVQVTGYTVKGDKQSYDNPGYFKSEENFGNIK